MKALPRRVTARRAATRSCKAASTLSSTRPQRASPPSPPSAGYTALSSRSLISIAGVDAPKFLQGIVTSNILNLQKEAEQNGFYTSILNAQGRVLHDVFVYRDTLKVGITADDTSLRPDDSFIIEVDEAQAQNLMTLIKRYKLRSKLKYSLLAPDECTAWHVWDDQGAIKDIRTSSTNNSIVLRDTRAPGLGHRVITARQTRPELDLDPSDETAYRIRRYLHGVPEGQSEIQREVQLPLEANLDLMGGIDFRKGCYVGQELTIRTKHRGIVRKRILPCVIYGENEPMPQRLEYDAGGGGAAEEVPLYRKFAGTQGRVQGRTANTWLGGLGNLGLSVCRLNAMTDIKFDEHWDNGEPQYDPAREHMIEWTVDEGKELENTERKRVKAKAFVPDWLRAKLDESSKPHT